VPIPLTTVGIVESSPKSKTGRFQSGFGATGIIEDVPGMSKGGAGVNGVRRAFAALLAPMALVRHYLDHVAAEIADNCGDEPCSQKRATW
jgi:hypothetical protein